MSRPSRWNSASLEDRLVAEPDDPQPGRAYAVAPASLAPITAGVQP